MVQDGDEIRIEYYIWCQVLKGFRSYLILKSNYYYYHILPKRNLPKLALIFNGVVEFMSM